MKRNKFKIPIITKSTNKRPTQMIWKYREGWFKLFQRCIKFENQNTLAYFEYGIELKINEKK